MAATDGATARRQHGVGSHVTDPNGARRHRGEQRDGALAIRPLRHPSGRAAGEPTHVVGADDSAARLGGAVREPHGKGAAHVGEAARPHTTRPTAEQRPTRLAFDTGERGCLEHSAREQ